MAKKDQSEVVPTPGPTQKTKTYLCKPQRPRLRVVKYKKICKNC